MTNALSRLLETRDWLMADGATGTNLFNMGLSSGDAPELWNVDEPDKIRALYRGAVDAGSDIFLTNSFGSNASRLKLHGAEKRVRELSRVAAELGREVADAAGRTVVVAGSMGPTGEIMEPIGELSHAAAVEIFHEQAEGLKEGGADVLWLETISAPEEYKAGAEAAKLAGMPWCGTMSFDTAGRTMMGVTSAAMAEMVEKLPYPPIAFGANCGVGASDLLRTILGFAASGTERPIIAKGNAGIPKYVHGRADGGLRGAGARLRRHHHRRLLRHHPRASARHARGAGDPPARRAPDAGDHRRKAGRVLLGQRRHV
jgi:5-methyltetrahydrofolate--homocysteine methyltransferase